MPISPLKRVLELLVGTKLWQVSNDIKILTWNRNIFQFEVYAETLMGPGLHRRLGAVLLHNDIISHLLSCWGTPSVITRSVWRAISLLTVEIAISLVCVPRWAHIAKWVVVHLILISLIIRYGLEI